MLCFGKKGGKSFNKCCYDYSVHNFNLSNFRNPQFVETAVIVKQDLHDADIGNLVNPAQVECINVEVEDIILGNR